METWGMKEALVRFRGKEIWKTGAQAVLLTLAVYVMIKTWKNLDALPDPLVFSEYVHFLLAFNPFRLLILFFAILTGIWALKRNRLDAVDLIIRYRFLLSILAVVLCVCFRLSGSSLHCFSYFFETAANGVLGGKPRIWRGDEFALNTTFAFSQAANGFHLWSTAIGAGADAYIVYGQPVADLSILFRPFQAGYLIFGAERGLAFFWSTRAAALFLTEYEFAHRFLGGDRKTALLFSVAICFSSFVQWWYAINGLLEMMISGNLAVILIDSYGKTRKTGIRILYSVLLAWMGCIFVLTFYPAWMVPLAYVYLTFSAYSIWQKCRERMFSGRDIILLLFAAAIMLSALVPIFLRSRETIRLVMNTAYPGKRANTGAEPWYSLFSYPVNLYTPFITWFTGIIGNQPEAAMFFSFFPAGLIMAVYHRIRGDRDTLSLLMIILSFFLLAFSLTDFPEWADKITLMQYTTAHRTQPIFGFVQLMLLFREMTKVKTAKRRVAGILLAAGVTAITVTGARLCYPDIFGKGRTVETALIVGAALFFTCRYSERSIFRKGFAVCLLGISFFSGALVNPVQQGAAELFENEITQVAEDVFKQDPEGIWIIEENYPVSNSLLPIGVRTLNSTHVYPNPELWERLDPEGKYRDVYNRYAHIQLYLTEEETSFRYAPTPDQFELYLNFGDIERTGADYILTRRDLSDFDSEKIQFIPISRGEHYSVYTYKTVDSE